MKAKRSSTNDIVLISKFCPLIFPNFPPALLLTYCRLFRHHLWFFKKSLYPPSIPGLSWDPVFGRLVNPISTGGHIMPTTLLRSPPPDFQNFRWPCILFLCISCTTVMQFENMLQLPMYVTIRGPPEPPRPPEMVEVCNRHLLLVKISTERLYIYSRATLLLQLFILSRISTVF